MVSHLNWAICVHVIKATNTITSTFITIYTPNKSAWSNCEVMQLDSNRNMGYAYSDFQGSVER